jgi:hypothetical protein
MSAPVRAQDRSPIEVFGGYSYFRLQKGANLNGWNASVALSINNWIKVVSDFSGHYGSLSEQTEFSDDDFPQISAPRGERARLHLILFGPQFSFYKNEKVETFFHILMGATHLRTDATARLDDIILNIPFAKVSYASAVGGGLDVKLNDSVSLRLIKADYVFTAFIKSSYSNARLSAGIVIH